MITGKYVSTGILMLLLCSNSYAQQKEKIEIEHATIFLNGAELSGHARITLPQGETEVLFTNIAGNVNQQSLNIGAGNGVTIQSSAFQNNYLQNQTVSPRVQLLKDSIELIQRDRAGVGIQLTVIGEQIALLSDNKQVAGANTGLSVAELTKMLDLVKAKMAGLLTDQDKLTRVATKMDEHIAKLQQQMASEQSKDYQPGGQLLVKFYAPKATSTDVHIAYIVTSAGWTPSYDLRVDNLKDPVHLFYKANVYQNSGINWDKIKITLSTGNPVEGAQAPVLNPWYLQFYNPVAFQPSPGYQMKNAKNLSLGGARSEGTQYMIDGVRVYGNNDLAANEPPTTIQNYVTVDNSGVNTSYDIDLPYTIPSDGQQHLVSVKSYDLPATFRYYAVPKLDRDVFLQAQITNWEDLNLLPAVTNIFYEGTYVGQGAIDVRNTRDTMNISLGRDKKIVIRRERDKELRSVRTIGSNVKESFTYKLDIRNTRKEAVNIFVIDQVPVSNDKDIVVEDVETDGANYDETTGAVQWTIKLAPNETVTRKLSYTVKYPKSKRINL
ncbi:MAG: DUF4139 domain-containing protein [Bacteroidetes bacterium]|nr:DUF4139 domain-containing protein [Bacteroidota bacterium]